MSTPQGAPAPSPLPTPHSALAQLRAASTAPRLTWYGDQERIELSGRVVLTWAAKVTGLLRDEVDVQPGDLVTLDLPSGHWRTAYWALGIWQLGARVALDKDAPTAATVTASAETANALVSGGGEVVLVTLPALARKATAALSPGVIDEAAVLNGQPDDAGPAYRWRTGEACVEGGGLGTGGAPAQPTTNPPARPALDGVDPSGRVWVPSREPLQVFLHQLLAIWSSGGSVLITDPQRPGLADLVLTEGAQRP